ncbi:Phosphate import ATP-binding protein PstB 1 [Choanephora cucurbitarum]|uniref:Phosphate import ATP-binding protein PstB 1 n=1 Tax=Choanephora cucurbitarum TaxID=101091 RepID=A0A1C7NBF7_9FUNG|nr:Phosphate import ATP-binding protein PstB 1 [Choanephora cucurbitarum]
MAIFQAHNISLKLPDGKWLFKDISFELNEGDTLVMRGPSGVGKTTLLKCIAELIPYDHGHSTLHDKTVDDYTVPIWRSRIMYVPQRPAAHPGTPMDFFNIIKKFGTHKDKKLDDPVKIGTEWNLSESHFREKWDSLSGGEMQRCALAIALALNPDILLLDEPTSALDPETIEMVEKTLKGKTCVWITHDSGQQERVGTNTLHLKHPENQDNEEEEDRNSDSTTIDMNHRDK